jgi:RimJ/RimL family protein N-acetyltransferase
MTADGAGYPGLAALSTGLRLETPRLVLRQFEERDLDPLAAIYDDKETMQHLGDGRTLTRDETWGDWRYAGTLAAPGLWNVGGRTQLPMVDALAHQSARVAGFELGWRSAVARGPGLSPEAAGGALQ